MTNSDYIDVLRIEINKNGAKGSVVKRKYKSLNVTIAPIVKAIINNYEAK